VIREHITLPPLKRNDNVVVHCVGAYNMTQWMQFIALRPAVVMIDMNSKPHLIRQREQLGNMEAAELKPDYLKEFKL
jgi:diaminopimelate decarboxylase